ncbi:manganese efflux pump MntP family protein [bacterium]|nr:manganese efflux pump MntP family protein [bacterium]
MEFMTIILISISLAMDALAVSLGIGTARQIDSLRGKVRLAAHFGIFQSGMTALGWVVGETIVQYVESFDHWIAFALLGYVGINLIRSGFDKDGQAFKQDPSTGSVLVMLSFATSIDAFAVGLGIVILKIDVLFSVIMIGLVAFLLTIIGLFAGIRLGEKFGKRMEIFGGVVLIGIGVRVLVTHLFP